jgi:hypothetical protein
MIDETIPVFGRSSSSLGPSPLLVEEAEEVRIVGGEVVPPFTGSNLPPAT